ncbi:hypothetical protein TorRG33x02_028110 [Trema orientale]|uniref:Uncharacterized protein n=1 Tax=Trema orientale TaxID=63057 RepID=A0A2P5FUN4_TREOI|nr:hypothetical protein TorRG33x02_028110 [Trema orientale]
MVLPYVETTIEEVDKADEDIQQPLSSQLRYAFTFLLCAIYFKDSFNFHILKDAPAEDRDARAFPPYKTPNDIMAQVPFLTINKEYDSNIISQAKAEIAPRKETVLVTVDGEESNIRQQGENSKAPSAIPPTHPSAEDLLKPEVEASVDTLLAANAFPDSMTDEMTKFLSNFESNFDLYEVARHDLKEVDALDEEIADLERMLVAKKAKREGLKNAIKILVDGASNSRQAFVDAERDVRLISLRKEAAELVEEMESTWEALGTRLSSAFGFV